MRQKVAWSKGTWGLARGEGTQDVSWLGQRQGLIWTGRKRLGWPKSLSSWLEKQWFHEKAAEDRKVPSPADQGTAPDGKGHTGLNSSQCLSGAAI